MGFHMVLKEKPHHWWSLINKLKWNFSIPPWEEAVAFRTAMLNCTAYDMPSFWSGLVLLNMYFRIFHSYVRIPWTNSKHFTCLHCESGFSMLFIGHPSKTSLLTCWWNHVLHIQFNSSRQWCFVPITTAGIRMLPPVPGKHGLAAYITFKNLEEAEPKKTSLPKLMAVKIVEVQHVVLGVGIVWNSRIKGNQCQIFWPFWVSFFWLPGQVGGGEHAQQSIERSSWTAVAWITDSRCSGVGEWHVKACSWKTAKLGLWVLEIKKLWLRVWFLLSRYGTWRGDVEAVKAIELWQCGQRYLGSEVIECFDLCFFSSNSNKSYASANHRSPIIWGPKGAAGDLL